MFPCHVDTKITHQLLHTTYKSRLARLNIEMITEAIWSNWLYPLHITVQLSYRSGVQNIVRLE